MPHVIAQLVFQPQKDIKTKCHKLNISFTSEKSSVSTAYSLEKSKEHFMKY